MIGLSHPGKFGDAIYSFPAARWLCNHHNCTADFYISWWFGSLKPLIDYQSWMKCVIPGGYNIDHFGYGAQPWDMSPYMEMAKYEKIYQFGFRRYPYCQVHEFYLREAGFNDRPNMVGILEYPDIDPPANEYVVLAPRGDKDFYRTYMAFMDKCPIKVVQIGAGKEYFEHPNAINCIGAGWLDTLAILGKAKAFLGLLSSNGGLAHNFDYPKVFLTHLGWGASIGQLPITPTTKLFILNDIPDKFLSPFEILDFMRI
jgi:hypothetical protein